MTTMQVYGPFVDGGLEGLFRGFVNNDRALRKAPAPVRIDVVERDNAYIVRAEIPGVKKDEITVTIEGDQVTIAAERKAVELQEGERALRTERYQGNLSRSFLLPVEIDEDASQAAYEGGVLELTLVKKAQQAVRKLTIQ